MEIDLSRLSRDFSNNPVKLKEDLLESDLFYLFMELNLTKSEVSEILGCTNSKVYTFCKKYNMIKDKFKISESQRNMYLRKYGVDNPMKNPEIAKRCAESYNNRSKSEKLQTSLKRKQTCKIKYGVEYISQSSEIKEKKRNTALLKYGETHANKSLEIKQKIKDTTIKNNNGFPFEKGSVSYHKYINTTIEKYGEDNAMKNPDISAKTSKTLKSRTEDLKKQYREKYGVDWPSQLASTIDKINETKRINQTYNTSKPQEQAKELLLAKYPDIQCEYKCRRYPNKCDFYIPCLDLFIELNYYWMHGSRPYDSNDSSCAEQLKIWQEKAQRSDAYKQAIKTWTNYDVQKMNNAIDNDLNYICFYFEEDFTEWYGKLP